MIKTKILIVGVGSIGTRHIRNLLLLGYRDIVLSDPSQEGLGEASRLGIFKIYADLQKALATEKPDVVLLCTPTHLHVPFALLALEYNAHVFIEKPISHTLQGIESLRRQAKKKRKVVMVACNYRFSKGFQKLQGVLQKRTFGVPLVVRVALGYHLPTARKGVSYKTTYAASRKMGGGVVLDSGSHVVDYLSVLFGKAELSQVFKSSLHSIGIQSEEAATLMIRHKSGVLSTVALDYVSKKPMHRIEIVTDRGVLTLNMKEDYLTFEDGTSKKTIYKGNADANAMYLTELKHFLKCVKDGLIPNQDITMGEETIKTLLSV